MQTGHPITVLVVGIRGHKGATATHLLGHLQGAIIIITVGSGINGLAIVVLGKEFSLLVIGVGAEIPG